jgi:ABC-type sugar transport system permease subunit
MTGIAVAKISELRAAQAGPLAAPFIAPALAVLCMINVLPFLWSIGVSFFHFRADHLTTPPRFLGFGNYLDLITDPDVWEHFENTGAMIGFSVSIQLVVGALLWTRMKTIADRYLQYPRILHPWPEKRFLVTIQGGSPVR